jgi:uncharacterized protein YndB with AHSA1/START domain
VTVTITAPAQDVWRSLTEPALVERWWGYAPEIEPRVGGKVTFGADGEVSAWEPNRVFAYTEDGMTTRWELAESAGTAHPRATGVTTGHRTTAPLRHTSISTVPIAVGASHGTSCAGPWTGPFTTSQTTTSAVTCAM